MSKRLRTWLANDRRSWTRSGGGLSAASGSNTLGRLEVYTNSVIDAGDGSSSLAFADSSACGWGGTLTINGRLGPTSLRVGTDASGLTAAQIAGINNRGARVILDIHDIVPEFFGSKFATAKGSPA